MSYFSKFPNMVYDFSKQGETNNQIIVTKDIIRRVKLKGSVASSVFAYDEYDIQEGERPDILAHQFYNSSSLSWIILLTNDILDLYSDWPRTERELKNMITKKYTGNGPYFLKGTDTSVGRTYSGVNGYYYPLFLTAKEAENYDRLQGFSGNSHTHQFSEFPSTTFYMPDGTSRGHATFAVNTSLYKLWTANSGPDGVHHYEMPSASGDTTRMIVTTGETYTRVTGVGVTQTFNSDVVTNRQYEERLNEQKRRIKILRPNLVTEFVEEFEQIIGE
jgi:hypothetical protein